MPGTRSNANPVRHVVSGYSNAATTANQYLAEFVAPFSCRIGAIKVSAATAGVGAGNQVVDVLINGTTAYTTAANKPTLLGTGTGEYTNTAPDVRGVQAGDVVAIQVTTIPATTGQARVRASVALELA